MAPKHTREVPSPMRRTVVLCLIVATCLTAAEVATGGTAHLAVLGVNLPALKLRGNATRGKRVFRTAACFQCHALKSAHSGAGFAGAPDLDKTKPSFALVVRRVALGYGLKGGTYTGFPGTMPAFSKGRAIGTPLTNQQIADVAKFVSSTAGQ
jgi:mono/diheme cytochrome c family protein